MRFSAEQVKQYQEEMQAVHSRIYGDINSRLTNMLNGISLPDISTVKDEYKELFTSLGEFCQNLKAVAEAGVSENSRDNYKNEDVISQSFNFGPIINSIDDIDVDDSAEDEEIDSRRINNTFDSILSAFDRVMALNMGSGMSDQDIQNVNAIINSIANFKAAYALRRLIIKAHEKKTKIDLVKQNMNLYQAEVEKYVKEVQAHYKERMDFNDLQKELKKAKEEAKLVEISLENDVEEYDNLSVYNKEIIEISNENRGFSEKILNASKELTNLSHMQMQVEDILDGCRAKMEQFEQLHVDLGRMEMSINGDILELKKTEAEIQRQSEIMQNCKLYEADVLEGKQFTKEEREALKQGVKLVNTIETSRQIHKLFADENVNVLLDNWIGSFEGKTLKELNAHLDEKAKVFCAPDSPMRENFMKARQIIEKLVNDYGMKPADAKAVITDDNYHAFAEMQLDIAMKGDMEYVQMGSKAFPSKEGLFYETIAKLKRRSSDYDEAGEKVRQLGELANELDLKIKKHTKNLKVLKQKTSDNGLAKWIKESFDKIKTLSKLPYIDSKIPAEFADNFKSSKTTVKVKNDRGLIRDYEDRLARLMKVGNELNQHIVAKKDSNSATINETAVKYADNEQRIEDIKKELRQEQLNRLTMLKYASDNQFAVIGHLENDSNREKYFKNWHARTQKDIAEAGKLADSMTTELDVGFVSTTLKTLLLKYRNLNDSREWRGNSPEYLDMINPLCKILGLPVPEYKQNLKSKKVNWPDAIKTKDGLLKELTELKNNAKEYILLKGDENVLHNTKQRYQRLTMANDLHSIAEELISSINLQSEIMKDCVNAQNEFKAAADKIPTVGQSTEAYGEYLNDLAKGNEVKKEYGTKEQPVKSGDAPEEVTSTMSVNKH